MKHICTSFSIAVLIGVTIFSAAALPAQALGTKAKPFSSDYCERADNGGTLAAASPPLPDGSAKKPTVEAHFHRLRIWSLGSTAAT